MAEPDHHPHVQLSDAAVSRLRVWMQERGITGTAEELVGGMLAGDDGAVITDAVLDDLMAYVDHARALHGPKWLDVLRDRSQKIDQGIPPIEPRNN